MASMTNATSGPARVARRAPRRGAAPRRVAASASSSARDHHRHGDLTTRRVVSDDAQRWRWRRASPAPSPSPSSSVRRRPRRVDANDAAANPNLSYYEVDDAELNARGDGDDGDDDGVPEMSSKEMFKRLVRFTLPTMAIWVCGPILGMIDTAVVGSASTLELAAMSPGGVYVDYPSYLISSALAVATTTLVAQDRLAEKRERKKARRKVNDNGGDGGVTTTTTLDVGQQSSVSSASTTADGLVIAAASGAVIGLILAVVSKACIAAFAGPASAAVVPAAVTYATIRLVGLPAAMVISVAQSAFLACRSPAQPLVAVLVAGVVNLVGDVALVVGLGKGIGGAALATIGSQITMAGALVYALLKAGAAKRRNAEAAAVTAADADADEDEDKIELPTLDSIPRAFPSFQTAMRFLKIAGPVCFLNAIKVFFVGSLVQGVTAISPEASAANGVMTAIYFFFAVMGDGVSQAAQTFLPPVLGSRRAIKTSLMLLASAMCLGLASAIASSAIATYGHGIFTTNAAVVDIMLRCAPVMSFALFCHTASMGSEGCLLAARDTKFMTLCYGPNAILAYATMKVVCIGRLGMGAEALWVALAQFHVCRLGANFIRMFADKSKGSPLRRRLVAS